MHTYVQLSSYSFLCGQDQTRIDCKAFGVCTCMLNEQKQEKIFFSSSSCSSLSLSSLIFFMRRKEYERERSKYKIMFRFLSLLFIPHLHLVLCLSPSPSLSRASCPVHAVRAPYVLYHLWDDLDCRHCASSSNDIVIGGRSIVLLRRLLAIVYSLAAELP